MIYLGTYILPGYSLAKIPFTKWIIITPTVLGKYWYRKKSPSSFQLFVLAASKRRSGI
jgi:hypothetical protein